VALCEVEVCEMGFFLLLENKCLLHSHGSLSLVFQQRTEAAVSRPQYVPPSDNRARNDNSEVPCFSLFTSLYQSCATCHISPHLLFCLHGVIYVKAASKSIVGS
jgi:hypothetical protein